MDDRWNEKEKKEKVNKCKNCSAEIDRRFKYCSICNEQFNNEVIITNRFPDNFQRTVDYHKLLIISKFKRHDIVILSFTDQYKPIANCAIDEIKHMAIEMGKRFIKKEKSSHPPHMKVEYIKAPLSLIPAAQDMKKDRGRKFYD